MSTTGICPNCYEEVDANNMQVCLNCGYVLKQPWPFSPEETGDLIVEGLESQRDRGQGSE